MQRRITPADAGKTCTVCAGNMRKYGSPPRMRGKLFHCVKCSPFRRITPADAGKTFILQVYPRKTQDHPRGCGENHYTCFATSVNIGSPPRMRGKPFSNHLINKTRRITPADAGKTASFETAVEIFEDHPRGCGENTLKTLNKRLTLGSPPRMRGKLYSRRRQGPMPRITPADAGKTVHPASSCMFTRGSPPRMRGKRRRRRGALLHRGITPADAGKTRMVLYSGRQHKDHPRGCGENPQLEWIRYTPAGSPPRMRGKHMSSTSTASCAGITPADAGKTLKRSFRNQPFCSRAVQISFNFSNSLNVSLQSGSAR